MWFGVGGPPEEALSALLPALIPKPFGFPDRLPASLLAPQDRGREGGGELRRRSAAARALRMASPARDGTPRGRARDRDEFLDHLPTPPSRQQGAASRPRLRPGGRHTPGHVAVGAKRRFLPAQVGDPLCTHASTLPHLHTCIHTATPAHVHPHCHTMRRWAIHLSVASICWPSRLTRPSWPSLATSRALPRT